MTLALFVSRPEAHRIELFWRLLSSQGDLRNGGCEESRRGVLPRPISRRAYTIRSRGSQVFVCFELCLTKREIVQIRELLVVAIVLAYRSFNEASAGSGP
jgi:hypothetical protein